MKSGAEQQYTLAKFLYETNQMKKETLDNATILFEKYCKNKQENNISSKQREETIEDVHLDIDEENKIPSKTNNYLPSTIHNDELKEGFDYENE